MSCTKKKRAIGSGEFFENPLRREFLPLEEVANFFNHSQEWVIDKVNEGILPCYHVGKTQRFFYVADIRNAILQNSLVLQRGTYDQKEEKQKRNNEIRSQGEEEWTDTLQKIRQRKRG